MLLIGIQRIGVASGSVYLTRCVTSGQHSLVQQAQEAPC